MECGDYIRGEKRDDRIHGVQVMPTTSTPIARPAWSTVSALCLLAAGALLAGCRGSAAPTTGGDTPVTAQRLSGTRLTDIRGDLSWTFDESVVVIDNNAQLIPADVADVLVREGATPVRVEANWRLDEAAGVLHLSHRKADGEAIDAEAAIPIAPAGHVRVNLGDRQYNMFRNATKEP